MVAFTTAKGLYQVANSSYVGTWDVPENSNWGVVDAALGQIVTIQLNNTPVTLTAGQVQSCQIIFSSSAAPGGNLAGSVVVTFPTVNPSSTELTGPYIIQNLCGNSSLYTVTLKTTVAGGQAIACKPGEAFDVINDGTNFKFKNLGHIGSLWDYLGSSTPNWVTACTVPPYLNCDGTSFSSATYPTLAAILGTTLPDTRGRYRATMNQGQSRINSTGSGLDGNTILASGGSEMSQQHNHNLTASITNSVYGGNSFGIDSFTGAGTATPTGASTIGVSVVSSAYGTGTYQNIPPTVIFGITMVRAG